MLLYHHNITAHYQFPAKMLFFFKSDSTTCEETHNPSCLSDIASMHHLLLKHCLSTVIHMS